jgi:septal ring factor EnvC (AmiA/AmiB activator)
MPKSLDKINQWIQEQTIYNEDGSIDNHATIHNFLSVCGESGQIEVKKLAEATGIARSQFYQVDVVKERVAKLRENLNKKYPNFFVGKKDSKKTARSKDKPFEAVTFDKTDHVVKELAREKSRLEKQLFEERSKIAQLEKENEALKKRLALYAPTIKAMQTLGVAPPLPVIAGSDD